MANLLDLLRCAEAAGLYFDDSGVLKAPRGIDPILLDELRANRQRIVLGLSVYQDADRLNDECGCADPIVRRWARLMALSTLLDGDEDVAVLAEAEAVLAIPEALRTPLVAEALRLGATVAGEMAP